MTRGHQVHSLREIDLKEQRIRERLTVVRFGTARYRELIAQLDALAAERTRVEYASARRAVR